MPNKNQTQGGAAGNSNHWVKYIADVPGKPMKTHSHAWYWKSEPAICIHLQHLISIFTAFFTLSFFLASELSRISGYGGVAQFFDQAVFRSSHGTVSWQTVLCDQDRWRDEWFFPEFLGTNHLHSGGSTSPQYHNRRAQPTWKLLTLQEVRVTHRLEEKKHYLHVLQKSSRPALLSEAGVTQHLAVPIGNPLNYLGNMNI